MQMPMCQADCVKSHFQHHFRLIHADSFVHRQHNVCSVSSSMRGEQDVRERYAAQRNVTHHNSSSSWAVVHKSQLAKSSFTMVGEQQLLFVAISLGDLELAALYDIEIVSLLTFPACPFYGHCCRTLLVKRSHKSCPVGYITLFVML